MPSDSTDGRRHSKALDAELIVDEAERAEAEARNGLLQFDKTIEMVRYWIESKERPFRLRPSHIIDLQRIALNGITSYAGVFRPAGIEISGSKHTPPDAALVPTLMEDMCDYVNDNFQNKTALHLCGYVMWRLNWIHPFTDGNGRTSRCASYLVLCASLKEMLPGSNTIPEQISKNRNPYFEALDAADAAWKEEKIDLSLMEEMLGNMLSAQLLSVVNKATGRVPRQNV